jgi:simple sugar transport system ATP-binding protein
VILDEPTAALERQAAQRLFERVRQLTASGVAVLYISHHLEEVFEICQDVVVLRDGEVVLTAPTASLSRDDLVAVMVGDAARAAGAHAPDPASGAPEPERPAIRAPAREAGTARDGTARDGTAGEDTAGEDTAGEGTAGEGTAGADVVLAVDGLVSDAARGRLSGVSLRVHAGEVVGVTGLLSAGVATLGRAVAGAENYTAGQVRLRGRLVPPGRRDVAQRAGIGYVPEDRRREGFVAHLGVAENATMTIASQLSGRLGVLRPGRRAAAAAPLTSRLSLVSSGPGQPAGELSGGNQQKVTVARTLAHHPSLIVAITPTRGVDVAAKELLLGSLADVARSGAAGVLLCSDELSDLAICDRVMVLVRGQAFTEFTRPPFDRDELIVATEGLTAATNSAAHDTAGEAAQ